MTELESLLGYTFKNQSLLLQALTHRSFSKEEGAGARADHNERLEFLGDAVLSLISAEDLYTRCPNAPEGELSQLRANYVCEASLAKAGRNLGLGDFIRTSKSMRASGPIDLPSVVADVMEALIAAAYLDGGFQVARDLVLKVMGPISLELSPAEKDYKTQLQERIQGICAQTPIYTVIGQSGPPHAPRFEVEVSIAQKAFGQGQGPSKKEAAAQAAKQAFEDLEKLSDEEIRQQLGQ